MNDIAAQRIRDAFASLANEVIDALGVDDDRHEPIERLLSIDEATRALNIGRTLAYKLIGEGRLRTVHVGRRVLVPASAIEAFVEDSNR